MIMRAGFVMRWLFIAIAGGQMPFEFHCIIENATYADQVRGKSTVEDEVARLANDAALVPRAFTAVTKMKTAYANSEFRT